MSKHSQLATLVRIPCDVAAGDDGLRIPSVITCFRTLWSGLKASQQAAFRDEALITTSDDVISSPAVMAFRLHTGCSGGEEDTQEEGKGSEGGGHGCWWGGGVLGVFGWVWFFVFFCRGRAVEQGGRKT